MNKLFIYATMYRDAFQFFEAEIECQKIMVKTEINNRKSETFMLKSSASLYVLKSSKPKKERTSNYAY
ncbi:hypothetical protein HNY73_021387 [Argiope bruennichi]|uniref:Uncharacterized protein n=1 Tax=Argiope bruennichi TaxID=94029 RepID=A0A8T0DXH9_ARGBR|nr:hypothetical protein HNY73_021387 [Argiope bruennichi]